MVFKDISENPKTLSTQSPAPHIDRFFANVIDFLILTPMITLFTGGISNDIRWNVFNKSPDLLGLFFQYVFVSFALFLLYDILFNYFHGATPGHRFLCMKLIGKDGRAPSLMALLFRATFKFQAILMGCIPFVEVILRPDRSTFYDRASQTQLVSLRETKFDDVHPDFKKILFRWTHTLVMLFFITIGIVFFKVVTADPSNIAQSKSVSKCTETLEQHLKNYLSKHKESENLECARILAEKKLDSSKESSKLYYLTQYIVTANDDLKSQYKTKYCTDNSNKIVCAKETEANYTFAKLTEEDTLNLLVDMNAALAKNQHDRIFTILDILYTHLDWNKNLELYYMTSYLFLTEQNGRSPASEKKVPQDWDGKKSRFLKRMSINL